MLMSKKIGLEVSEQDAATLEFMQAKCRGQYNMKEVEMQSVSSCVMEPGAL